MNQHPFVIEEFGMLPQMSVGDESPRGGGWGGNPGIVPPQAIRKSIQDRPMSEMRRVLEPIQSDPALVNIRFSPELLTPAAPVQTLAPVPAQVAAGPVAQVLVVSAPAPPSPQAVASAAPQGPQAPGMPGPVPAAALPSSAGRRVGWFDQQFIPGVPNKWIALGIAALALVLGLTGRRKA